jgi:hypothetical protein
MIENSEEKARRNAEFAVAATSRQSESNIGFEQPSSRSNDNGLCRLSLTLRETR